MTILIVGCSRLLKIACKTDLESEKMTNLLSVLVILTYRNAETNASNSAVKIDDLSSNRIE